MKKTLALAPLLAFHLLTTTARADNFMVIMGAGGEEAKPETIFDTGIKNLASYARNSAGLKLEVALNGGHSETSAIIEKEFPSGTPTSQFRESDFKRLIDQYTKKLERGDIKEGDQLMIYIDTHGAEKDSGTKTHRVSTAEGTAVNLDNLRGSTMVNLDDLEPLKKLAARKKVKMAIIDASCHSGNTIALADENTCVISSSGPDHYGYSSFGNAFPLAMNKGKTLEEVFLEVRRAEYPPSFPMISTSEGMSIYNELYAQLTPFLYSFDEKNDKLTPYLLRNKSAANACITDSNFKSLMSTIDKIEEMNTVTKKVLWWTYKNKEVDFTELKRLLTNYKKIQDEAMAKLAQLDSDQLKTKETIDGFMGEYTWQELLQTNYDDHINKLSERMRAEPDETKKEEMANTLRFYSLAKTKQQEIQNAHPELATNVQRQKEVMRSLGDTRNIASTIALEERKLFDVMYKQAEKANPDKSKNPCHNFKL